MTIALDTDSQGNDTAYFCLRGEKVVTIRQIGKHRDGTIFEEDLDGKNEFLGLAVTGKIKVVDKRK